MPKHKSIPTFEIIIPIGNISVGNTKTRLSSNLNELQRKNLTIWLLNHVVTNSYNAFNQLKVKPNIVILGNSYPPSQLDYISHIYSIKNQIPIKELGQNLNESLQQYIHVSQTTNKLILPADLGMLETTDILQFVQKSNDFKTPVIAKATKDNGTNGILLPMKNNFQFSFGENSFDSHIKILNKYEEINSPGVNYDIDDHSDLIELMKINDNIRNVLDTKGKIVIPINKFRNVGTEIKVKSKCNTFRLLKNIELKESQNIIYYNTSIDISIH